MVRSMTGFARAESANATRKCTVELRTVNNRFLEFNIRMPSKNLDLEKRIKKAVADRLARGYLEIAITLSDGDGVKKRLALDEDLVLQLIGAANTLKAKFGVSGEPDLPFFLSMKDIIRFEEEGASADERWALIRPALETAMDELIAMREAEGAALKNDIVERLNVIDAGAEAIFGARKKQEAEIVLKFKARLEELTAGIDADPHRVLMEAGVLAERSDISEEIIRLRCHIKQVRELLEKGGAVGRKLEFIVQEMNREANTIGAKSSLYDISRDVVEIKSNLEKIREQAANVE